MHNFHICNFPLSSLSQSLAVPVCKASLIPVMDGMAQGGWRGAHTLIQSPGAIQWAAVLCTASSFPEGLCNGQPSFLRPQASTYQAGMCSNEETAPHYHVFRWFFSTAQDART